MAKSKSKSKSPKIKYRKVRVVNPAVDPGVSCCMACALEGRPSKPNPSEIRSRNLARRLANGGSR